MSMHTNRSGSSSSSIKVKLPFAAPSSPSPVPISPAPTHQNAVISQPQKNPPALDKNQVERLRAAWVIERAWLRYRDKQMFRLLKHAVCAAEHSLSYEILKKVVSREAQFLRDKCFQCRVRFRFGGTEFPPMIFFKIFVRSNNGITGGLKYISGKRMIQPASEAARDACDLMGSRKFLEQMVQDALYQQVHKISDETDVATLKDYMQYLSLLDETPASMGGRDNTWRKLTLDVLPRQTMFYDVVDFLYSHKVTARLKEEIPALLLPPTSNEAFLQHIGIISTMRPVTPPMIGSSPHMVSSVQTSARRSRQAKSRATKMRKIYSQQTDETDKVREHTDLSLKHENVGDDILWEEEAEKLYEWTQELSFDDIAATPRLHTAQFITG